MSPDGSFFQMWIQGRWVACDLEYDGDRFSDHLGVDATEEEYRAAVQEYWYTFAEDRFEGGRSGATIEGKFQIDELQSPTAIDFKSEEGHPPILGIMTFEDERLVISVAPPGEERPKVFQSPEGCTTMVFVLERE